MISLLKLISEMDIHKFDPPIEEPSHYENENEQIAKYVQEIEELHPNGILPFDVLMDIEEYPVKIQLKTLIELAKRKLLNSQFSTNKLSPQDVLGIYGNPKDVLKKAQFNMNERN